MVVRLGITPTAALGVSGRWFFLINLTFFGFASGMSVMVSQYWGMHDIKSIRKSFGMGLINAMAIGCIMTILLFLFTPQFLSVFTNDAQVIAEGVKYLKIACWTFIPMSVAFIFSYLLRSTEIVVLPLITTVISVATNTALNYILIFGKLGFPALGIRGAAIATLVSATLQMLLIVSISYIKKNVAASRIKELFDLGCGFVKKYYVLALPVLANEVLWALGVSVYNMVFGRMGSDNYAAFTIYGSIEQLMFTFFIGICSACAVIVGKMVGRGEAQEAYDTAKKFMIYGTVFAFAMGIIVIFVRNPIISLLSVPDPQTAAMVSRLLFIYAFAIPLYILPFIAIVGIFRSGGDTKRGLIYDIINVWFIGVPIVALAGLLFKLPFEWVFGLMWTEHVVKTIMCLLYFRSRKWIRRITVPESLDA
jgi:putative MATE family efflux protein